MHSDVPSLLDHAQILEISGKDSLAFANAQFSSDVSSLGESNWQWSAWLDAQGRVRNVFALLRPDAERLLAWLPYGRSTEIAGQLSRFVFRSKVVLTACEDFALLEGAPAQSAPGQLLKADSGWSLQLTGASSRRAVLRPLTDSDSIDPAALNAWRLADIEAGLPWIDDAASAEFTAAALGLDRLGAISLNKGCYPGQEIVARLHFRGGNKRSSALVRIESERIPASGETLHVPASGAMSGTILYAARLDSRTCQALAIVPIDCPRGAGLALACGDPVVVERMGAPNPG